MSRLFIFAGLPATGKTTLARQLARHLNAVHLRIDTIEQALRDLCNVEVEGEEARCKQVAWQAAESREMWEQFQPKRMTTEPVNFDESGIQCYLDQQRFDTVEVAIPSGGLVGWHPAWISVTVARGTYEVLGMHESCWP